MKVTTPWRNAYQAGLAVVAPWNLYHMLFGLNATSGLFCAAMRSGAQERGTHPGAQLLRRLG
jgi:hypothetical protein